MSAPADLAHQVPAESWILGSICTARDAQGREIGFGIRVREHGFAILTSVAVMNRVEVFVFDSLECIEAPGVEISVNALGNPHRVTPWPVELPGACLRLLVFTPSSLNGQLMQALTDEPPRYFPGIFLHMVDDTQIPYAEGLTEEEKRAAEEEATRFNLGGVQREQRVVAGSGNNKVWTDHDGNLTGFQFDGCAPVMLTPANRGVLAAAFYSADGLSEGCTDLIEQQYPIAFTSNPQAHAKFVARHQPR